MEQVAFFKASFHENSVTYCVTMSFRLQHLEAARLRLRQGSPTSTFHRTVEPCLSNVKQGGSLDFRHLLTRIESNLSRG